MIPYNGDTRDTYVQRQMENHLFIAEKFCELGNERSMWLQLFSWAMSEDIYGVHWDLLQGK